MTSKLIELLSEFDAATLYEAAGQKGMVDPTIRPAWQGAALCGPAATVRCPPGDNLALHQAVAAAQPGVVLVASVGGYRMAGAWGEVLTVAAQARGIDGAVRDIDAIGGNLRSAVLNGRKRAARHAMLRASTMAGRCYSTRNPAHPTDVLGGFPSSTGQCVAAAEAALRRGRRLQRVEVPRGHARAQVAPALAWGNTVVFKPAALTPHCSVHA